jgi:MtN3 and saliva related transmembrane protein
VAGTITTTAFLPQFFKALKTKSAKDISFPMLLMTSVGNGLWLIYALVHSALALALANTVTLMPSVAICFLKIKYDK